MSQSIRSYAIQPDTVSESYWQPIPANGFVEVHVSRHRTATTTAFESARKTVAPVLCENTPTPSTRNSSWSTRGKASPTSRANRTLCSPGPRFTLAAQEKHKFTNTGDGPLRFFWVLMPGGLSDFFKAIGQVRHAGDEAPEPFPRPENVAQIEADIRFCAN